MSVLKRFVALVLCVVTVMCTLSVFAGAEGNAEARIVRVNVEYKDKLHLALQIETEGELDGTVGIGVYDGEELIYESYVEKLDGKGNAYYAGHGVPAAEITTEYKYVVLLKAADGTVSEISEPLNYSIADYAYDRLDDADVTEAQANLYRKLIAYGEAADKIFE